MHFSGWGSSPLLFPSDSLLSQTSCLRDPEGPWEAVSRILLPFARDRCFQTPRDAGPETAQPTLSFSVLEPELTVLPLTSYTFVDGANKRVLFARAHQSPVKREQAFAARKVKGFLVGEMAPSPEAQVSWGTKARPRHCFRERVIQRKIVI